MIWNSGFNIKIQNNETEMKNHDLALINKTLMKPSVVLIRSR